MDEMKNKVVIVPVPQMNEVLNYLAKQPFHEVEGLIRMIMDHKPEDAPKADMPTHIVSNDAVVEEVK